MKSEKPIIHGRDHEHGGADPSRTVWEDVAGGLPAATPCVVVPAVCGDRYILWSGWHGLIDSGPEAVTILPHTLASSSGGGAGGVETWTFYDGTEGPDELTTDTPEEFFGVTRYHSYGVAFETTESDVEVSAIQFHRDSGAGRAYVKLHKSGTLVATGSGNANPGWNQIPCGPILLEPSTTYQAVFYTLSTPAGTSSPGNWPKAAGTLAATVASNPGRVHNDAFPWDIAYSSSDDEFYCGPVVRQAASAAWYDGSETATATVPNNVEAYGVAFDCLADGVTCSGVQFLRASGTDYGYVRLWSSGGVLLGSGEGEASSSGPWNRIALDASVGLVNGETYVVDWWGGYHGKIDPPAWGYAIALGAGTVAEPVATNPGRSGGTATAMASTAEDVDYLISPILEATTPLEPGIIVVATPAVGTVGGAYITMATADAANVYLYWSLADTLVSANVMAIGGASTA